MLNSMSQAGSEVFALTSLALPGQKPIRYGDSLRQIRY